MPRTQKEANMNMKKRIAANDPAAMSQRGFRHFNKREYKSAFKYYTKAAELGDVDAHFALSIMYETGEGAEKDEMKQLYHLEQAAIAGHPGARFNIGVYEERNGRIERAVKHYIIAANLGRDESIQALKKFYKDGKISKERFAAALRAHHAAVDATKSPQREAAVKFFAEHA